MIHSICNLNKFDPIKGIETIGMDILCFTTLDLNKFDPIKGIETIPRKLQHKWSIPFDLNKFDPIKGIETS